MASWQKFRHNWVFVKHMNRLKWLSKSVFTSQNIVVCSICEQSHFHTSVRSNKFIKRNTMKHAYTEKFKKINELKRLPSIDTEYADETPASVRMYMEQYAEKIGPEAEKEDKNMNENNMSKSELLKRLASLQWDISSLIKKSKSHANDGENEVKERMEKGKVTIENLSREGYAEEVSLEDLKFQTKKPKLSVQTTTDPAMPISDIPCNGCGAFLHCQDHAVAGFLPSEKFKTMSVSELGETFCQRCTMIRNHNMHLKVDLPEDTFPKLFSRIREDKNCLVLLLVDLLDIPDSINPNILEWVGKRQQFYVIGNKVDLIPKDENGYLERVENAVRDACFSSGFTEKNIRHMCLVSGKTGYGIERLITKLIHDWERQGDVYLIGNANSGKSTLFNTLLQSDYCKSSVRLAIKRATISDWPGTTLSLLKFPIVNMEPWKLSRRMKRFKKEQIPLQEELALRKSRVRQGKYSFASLWGHVGVTDFRDDEKIEAAQEKLDTYSGFDIPMFDYLNKYKLETRDGRSHIKDSKKVKFDPRNYLLAKWMYDTPGIQSAQQIFSFLSQEELVSILPRQLIVPQTFLLHPQRTLFITGLSRIDYIQGEKPMYITVFTAASLPVCDTDLDQADDFYKDNIGKRELKNNFSRKHTESTLTYVTDLSEDFMSQDTMATRKCLLATFSADTIYEDSSLDLVIDGTCDFVVSANSSLTSVDTTGDVCSDEDTQCVPECSMLTREVVGCEDPECSVISQSEESEVTVCPASPWSPSTSTLCKNKSSSKESLRESSKPLASSTMIDQFSHLSLSSDSIAVPCTSSTMTREGNVTKPCKLQRTSDLHSIYTWSIYDKSEDTVFDESYVNGHYCIPDIPNTKVLTSSPQPSSGRMYKCDSSKHAMPVECCRLPLMDSLSVIESFDCLRDGHVDVESLYDEDIPVKSNILPRTSTKANLCPVENFHQVPNSSDDSGEDEIVQERPEPDLPQPKSSKVFKFPKTTTQLKKLFTFRKSKGKNSDKTEPKPYITETQEKVSNNKKSRDVVQVRDRKAMIKKMKSFSASVNKEDGSHLQVLALL